MADDQLVQWGKNAFAKGISIEDIESQLMQKGMHKEDALGTLHEITAFEHKVHDEVEDVRKVLISIPILIILVFSGVLFLHFAGIIKLR